MNARELIAVGSGLVIAVFLAGCMVFAFSMLGITGFPSASLVPPVNADPAPDLPAYDRTIPLDVPLPASPATVPLYRVVSVEQYSSGTGTALTVKKQIPSIEEAPGLAEAALAAYGGLPADAVLERTEQVFMRKYNIRTETVEEQYPQYTQVMYRQYVNGSPVMNSGISVLVGEKGELLDISKDWSTLAFSGEVPVISAEEAMEKLRARDLLRPVQCSLDGYHVTRVQSGYYVGTFETQIHNAPGQAMPPDTVIPVWIFYGIKPGTDTDPFPLLINATRG
ncbi:MAG: hypothetical protein M0R30_09530 [Methanoregula sp.]|jgi:hypothetical protein|uniref:hypothetical protein n=1 Tax=Methanoregula sp. TaxID=2052170 RepID=UPI0025F9F905|nr:hypothetical protein [Methanoregula sp.]MCK9631872.1 hypothetical protein [Methanoregula sp.]